MKSQVNWMDRLKWLVALSIFGYAIFFNSYFTEIAFLYRVLAVVGLIGLGFVVLAFTQFGVNTLKLMSESRLELRRVVWPTRMETTQTFLVVVVAIIVLALLLWGLESLLSWITKLILG